MDELSADRRDNTNHQSEHFSVRVVVFFVMFLIALSLARSASCSFAVNTEEQILLYGSYKQQTSVWGVYEEFYPPKWLRDERDQLRREESEGVLYRLLINPW